MLHSVTNYECYKGLYSSFNSYNFFEIAYSLNRQFGSEPWTLYKGKHLLCFADNHDVTRLASILTVKEHIPLLYTLLFTMPGIPCLYYGSEWGMEGEKSHGDDALRPAVDEPVWNGLCDSIASLCAIHKQEKALCYGDYTQVALTNRQYVFARACDGERVVAALNADNAPATLPAPGLQGAGDGPCNGRRENLFRASRAAAPVGLYLAHGVKNFGFQLCEQKAARPAGGISVYDENLPPMPLYLLFTCRVV